MGSPVKDILRRHHVTGHLEEGTQHVSQREWKWERLG